MTSLSPYIPSDKARENIAYIEEAILDLNKLLEKGLEVDEDQAEIDDLVTRTLPFAIYDHRLTKRFINLSVTASLEAKVWQAIEKILHSEASKLLSQGSIIHILWISVESDKNEITQMVVRNFKEKLRERDLKLVESFDLGVSMFKQTKTPLPSPVFSKDESLF